MSTLGSLLLAGDSPHLSVGLISADLMRLGDQVQALERLGVRLAHFDVMDGHFAPPLTVGATFVAGVKTRMLKDVHLMVDEPLGALGDYAAAGADIITVHVEACRHPHRALQAIGELTNKNDPSRPVARGIALNPSSPVELLEPLVETADFIMLLAINPGFPRQRFLDATEGRLARVRRMIAASGRAVATGIDGGVTRDNIAAVAALRPDIVVTGSAVFEGGRIEENLAKMRAGLTQD